MPIQKIDGKIVITLPNYKIALAMGGKLLESARPFPADNPSQDKAIAVMSKALKQALIRCGNYDENDWKRCFSAGFTFTETALAEEVCNAIEWFHGARPQVFVSRAQSVIHVTSPGYQCY